jgi:hypothetical protein
VYLADENSEARGESFEGRKGISVHFPDVQQTFHPIVML